MTLRYNLSGGPTDSMNGDLQFALDVNVNESLYTTWTDAAAFKDAIELAIANFAEALTNIDEIGNIYVAKNVTETTQTTLFQWPTPE